MAQNKGWICLYRQIQNHYLWDEKPFSKQAAWIDLLLLANFEDKKMVYKEEVITCQRGTVNLSILSLSERWGWDRKTVRRFLKILESDGMVTVNATTHRTVITIVNYEKYQNKSIAEGTTEGTTDGAISDATNGTENAKQEGTEAPITNNIYTSNTSNTYKHKDSKSQKHKYGEYQNVLLSDLELEKLRNEFPADWRERIEDVSEYCASSGKSYKDYLATIRRWAKNNEEQKMKGEKGVISERNSEQRSGMQDIDEPIPGLSL